MKLIKNVNVVALDKIIYNACVETSGDKINRIFTTSVLDESVYKTIIDGNGQYLIPGFIDIHCHGGSGYDFLDATASEMQEISAFYLQHGTTTLVPTSCACSNEELVACFDQYAKYLEENDNSNLTGFHMEGPYFSPAQCGAQNTDYFTKPNIEFLEDSIKKYPFITRISAAPEVDEDYKLSKFCSKHGLVCGVAHTDANFSQIEEAMNNGYSVMTHLYSGMQGVHRVNAYRIAGAVEAGLYFDELYTEVIADGKHLPIELLKYIYKLKGADKIIMVTDGTRASGLPDGGETFVGTKTCGIPAIIEDGVAKLLDRKSFAGSASSYDQIFKVMAKAIGGDFIAMAKMSSTNAAKLLGLIDRGEIAVGKKADLLIVNQNFEIEKIIYNGDIVK